MLYSREAQLQLQQLIRRILYIPKVPVGYIMAPVAEASKIFQLMRQVISRFVENKFDIEVMWKGKLESFEQLMKDDFNGQHATPLLGDDTVSGSSGCESNRFDFAPSLLVVRKNRTLDRPWLEDDEIRAVVIGIEGFIRASFCWWCGQFAGDGIA